MLRKQFCDRENSRKSGFLQIPLLPSSAEEVVVHFLVAAVNSPPRRGGVDVPSIKWIRSEMARPGWSGRRNGSGLKPAADLTTITASRYRARASRPAAALR